MLICALACLFLLAHAAPGSAQVFSEEYVILTGHVVDQKGRPVPNARVEFFPFAASSGMPRITTTDADGYFSLRTQPIGEGIVSASKPEAGYPDELNAIYEEKAARNRVRVNTKQGANPPPVVLTFGAPHAVIRWKIQSASPQVKLPGAYIHIALASDPKIVDYGTYPVDREFVFVLPRQPITITIGYIGFRDWTPEGTPGLSYPILLVPGTVDTRVIKLEPK